MTKIFLANPTRQHQRFYYRLDFAADGMPLNPRLQGNKHTPLRPGEQQPIHGDLAPPQVSEIIEQLKTYGAKTPEEAKRSRAVVTLIYQEGRQMTANQINDIFRMNKGLKAHEGQVRRRNAAIVSSDAIVHQVEEMNAAMNTDIAVPDKVDVEFEQVEGPSDNDDGPRLEEGIRVRREAPPKGGPKRGGKAPARRAA